MASTAIKVEQLSKKYLIGKTASLTLRDSLANMFRKKSAVNEVFWALKDVSFEIDKGDIVGVVGSNGAGKSTLLKVLSKITYPTKGRIELDGRVTSLLEVGTGFHPELTGKENIFLNGSLLGMKRSEIRDKMDAIIDFSGVEKFLDTPVKRYSSGMYVRLAFSVAAHLNSEILLIDEVLAVGDHEFQQKCLGKMDDVAKSGRTVLLVSHNMNYLSQICHSTMWLSEGRLKGKYSGNEGIVQYLSFANDDTERYVTESDVLKIENINTNSHYLRNEDLNIETLILNNGNYSLNVNVDIAIKDYAQNEIIHIRSVLKKQDILTLEQGLNKFRIQVKKPNLLPGLYHFVLYIYDNKGVELLWFEKNGCIEIKSDDVSFPNGNIQTIKTKTLPEFEIVRC